MAKDTYHKYIVPLIAVAVGALVAWGSMQATVKYTMVDVKRMEILCQKDLANLELNIRREIKRLEESSLPRETFDVYTRFLETRLQSIEDSLVRIENIYKNFSYEKGS